MDAERVFLETDEFGNLIALPKLPPRRRVEAIFLVLPEGEGPGVRGPHPALAGRGRFQGDLIAPALDDADWDMNQ